MSNLDYTLGLLTNIFTQFYNGLLNQQFTYPTTSYFANELSGCNTWTSSCTGSALDSGTITTIKPNCAGRNSLSKCSYKYLSGCAFNANGAVGVKCSGTAADGLDCASHLRQDTEQACEVFGRGSTQVYVSMASGCTWGGSSCTGTANQDAPTCASRTTSGACTALDTRNSTATYNGCVWNDRAPTKTCMGTQMTPPASGTTALACSALNAVTACACEKFCISNTNPNAYYTALNEVFNNYTRYNSIEKVNY